MVRTFHLPLRLVSVTSLLTIGEFVICTAAVFSLSSIFFGCWILKLHYKKEIKLSIDTVNRNSIVRKLAGLFLGAWFACSVALFEQGLKPRPIVLNQQRFVSSCLRLDREYDWTTYLYFRPPLSYNLDDASFAIANQLNCDGGQVVSVDFGKSSRIQSDEGDQLFAPFCLQNEDNTLENNRRGRQHLSSPLNGTVDIPLISFGTSGSTSLEPIVELFPHDISFSNKSRSRSYMETYEYIDECEKKNISSYSFRHFGSWDLANVDDYSVSLSIQNELCRLHGSAVVNETQALKQCLIVGPQIGVNLDLHCVREKFSPFIHKQILYNVSMLIAKSRETKADELITQSSACISSDVEISYIFIPSDYLSDNFRTNDLLSSPSPYMEEADEPLLSPLSDEETPQTTVGSHHPETSITPQHSYSPYDTQPSITTIPIAWSNSPVPTISALSKRRPHGEQRLPVSTTNGTSESPVQTVSFSPQVSASPSFIQAEESQETDQLSDDDMSPPDEYYAEPDDSSSTSSSTDSVNEAGDESIECDALCRRRRIWLRLKGYNRQSTGHSAIPDQQSDSEQLRFIASKDGVGVEHGMSGSAKMYIQSGIPSGQSSLCYTQQHDIPKGQYILVPIRFETSGKCEPAVYPLARASILHSNNADWTGKVYSKTDRRARFWAYTISFSRFIFPKTVISDTQLYQTSDAGSNDNNISSCLLNEVMIGTQFETNIWFISLILVSSVGILTCIVGVIFRLVLPKSSWNVPYYGWNWSVVGGYYGNTITEDIVNEDDGDGDELLLSNPNNSFNLYPPISNRISRIKEVIVKVQRKEEKSLEKENEEETRTGRQSIKTTYTFHTVPSDDSE